LPPSRLINYGRAGVSLKVDTEGSPAELVDVLMEEGPSTARANEDLVASVEGMKADDIHFLLVSTPEGHPLGLLFLQDATKRLERGEPKAPG